MGEVTLRGELVCQDATEAAVVARLLPGHVALTRAEPGCRAFEVEAGGTPLVWRVAERYADPDAFRAHQARTADSEWGRATLGIERRYTIDGLDG